MSNTVKLSNFTDFDRLLVGKNLIITLIGAIGAFVISDLQLFVPLPVIPFSLSLTISIMILVAIFTKNFASSLIVGLFGSIGLLSTVSSIGADWVLGYILINVLLLLLLGFLANKLQLIMHWTRFYLFFGIIFTLISLGFGLTFNPLANEYWSRGIIIGAGGDFLTGTGYPVIDIGIAIGLISLALVVFFLTRGQILLTEGGQKLYTFFGILIYLIGQIIAIIPIVLWFEEVPSSKMRSISVIDNHLNTVTDLFTHTRDKFAVYSTPFNIFFVMAATTMLTMIGISLITIGKHHGNLEGIRGGSEITHLAAPLAFTLYFTLGHYFVQSFLFPGGFFISIELFPLFATMIWSVYYINQMIARIILLIMDRL